MITVREATQKDIPNILDFQLKLALETEDIQLDIQTLTEGVQRLFKDPTKGKYYVAMNGDETIGCLLITHEWSDWRCGMIWWIQSVYVSEPHRGKGVFSAMYSFIRSIVESDPGLKGLRLYVENRNQGAQEVYRRIGMNGDHYHVFEWLKEG